VKWYILDFNSVISLIANQMFTIRWYVVVFCDS